MGMLVVTALVTFFVQRQELWSIGKKAAVKMAGTAVVDVLAPGLHYEEKENGNHFLAKVEKILFPIADYTVQIQSYETDAESTLSYEMILAMEALDENYVDENGQVVMQNNGGTDSPQPADGTQNADNPQAADGAQNADNSQAAATAQNPDTSQETSDSAGQASLMSGQVPTACIFRGKSCACSPISAFRCFSTTSTSGFTARPTRR